MAEVIFEVFPLWNASETKLGDHPSKNFLQGQGTTNLDTDRQRL
jgi:hypothetical protein